MTRPVGRFPPRQRVRKRSEYQSIQARARRVVTRRHVLLVYARDDSSGARVGTIASRKVGNAAERNRAKRLIREAFRATRWLWPDDVDVVVIVRRPPSGEKLADVIEDWTAAAAAVAARVAEARKDRSERKSAPGLAEPA